MNFVRQWKLKKITFSQTDMNEQDVKEIKKISKDAYDYMAMLFLKYHKKKNFDETEKFIINISLNHDKEDIETCINDLISTQKRKKHVYTTYLSIVIPMFVVLFSFVSGLFGGIMNLMNSVIMKQIDVLVENMKNKKIDSTVFKHELDHVLSGGSKTEHMLINHYGEGLLASFGFLLCLFVYSTIVSNRAEHFISILRSAKYRLENK